MRSYPPGSLSNARVDPSAVSEIRLFDGAQHQERMNDLVLNVFYGLKGNGDPKRLAKA
jgi:hypothetical protein